MTAAYCSECGKPLSKKNKSDLCRSHLMRARMKALHADPEFAARHIARHSARMKALNADPARNPLVLLTAKERADYDILKRAGYTRFAALRSIGRADLASEAAE